jgi:hypothetical protein
MLRKTALIFLDKTLRFIFCEQLVPPSTGIVKARVLPSQEDLNIINHHATTTKMPSTIFIKQQDKNTDYTSHIDTFYRYFQWGLSACNSFWTHDDELIIVPTERKMEFS